MNITYEQVTVPVINWQFGDSLVQTFFYIVIGFFTLYGLFKFIQNFIYCCSE